MSHFLTAKGFLITISPKESVKVKKKIIVKRFAGNRDTFFIENLFKQYIQDYTIEYTEIRIDSGKVCVNIEYELL